MNANDELWRYCRNCATTPLRIIKSIEMDDHLPQYLSSTFTYTFDVHLFIKYFNEFRLILMDSQVKAFGYEYMYIHIQKHIIIDLSTSKLHRSRNDQIFVCQRMAAIIIALMARLIFCYCCCCRWLIHVRIHFTFQRK